MTDKRSRKAAFITGAKIVVYHGAVVIALLWPPSIAAVVVAVLLYLARGFGISLGFHRLLAHRSFKTGRVTQFVLAALGTLALQGGPIWWPRMHRTHHRRTDEPEDPHSPKVSFFHGHVGWAFDPKTYETRHPDARDLKQFPELCWLDRHSVAFAYAPVPLLALLGFFAPISWGTGPLELVLWGQAVSVVFLWHCTWLINSLCHFWGNEPAPGHRDSSRNNGWLAPFTFGEAWHENHHRYPSSARLGLRGQFDPGWVVLTALRYLGLAWDVREPHVSASTATTPDRTSVLMPE